MSGSSVIGRTSVIWQAAKAPRLYELLENLYAASQRFRNLSILLPGRVEQIDDNPPWVRPFETLEQFQAVLDCDPLDFAAYWRPFRE